MRNDMARLWRSVEPRRPFLCGHEVGGRPSSSSAISLPARSRSTALIGTARRSRHLGEIGLHRLDPRRAAIGW
jgi:hypothetical protein